MIAARAYLVDLDGTLIQGGRLLPGAAELVASLESFVVLSNDSEHTPEQLAHKLAAMGLPIDAGHIFLAGTCAVDLVARERPRGRIMIIGSRALIAYARMRGLRAVARNPDIVLVARDRNFSYRKLLVAANAIRQGAALVVANPDLVHPGANGAVVPETGSLLSALLSCTGPVAHRIVGKPEPGMFLEALGALGVAPKDATMIGDNPDTDGVGATRLGIAYLPAGQKYVSGDAGEGVL